MELNKISQRLLAEGWTKDETPPGMREWNDFYGGWTFSVKTLRSIIWETPCGLLVGGGHFVSGHMSFMGVDWTAENNCPTITCPRFDLEHCNLVDKLLAGGGLHGSDTALRFCACSQSHSGFDYERSLDKAHDDVWKEADARWEEFAAKRSERVCRFQSIYNRNTKVWTMHYDPMECSQNHCLNCAVVGCDISPKKANIFYDLKCIEPVKGEGLFPDENKIRVIKGLKLFKKPISVTKCEILARIPGRVTSEVLSHKHGTRDSLLGIEYEVLNIRVGVRETRDLLQDLQDVAEGVEVVHASDSLKAAKAAKSQRRQTAKDKKLARLERLVLERGYYNLGEHEQRHVDKWLGADRIEELEEERLLRRAEPVDEPEQMGLWEENV